MNPELAARNDARRGLLAGRETGHGYVYLTTNPLSNDVRWYVGKHRANAFDPKYKGSGRNLEAAFKDYGRKNFTVEVLCWAQSEKELYDLEKFHVAFYRSLFGRDRMYNIAKGGPGGGCFAEETKRQISAKLKGRKIGPPSEIHRQRLSESLLGHPVSEDARLKMRIAKIGNANHSGHKHSEDTRQKMAEKKLGKKWSPERRAAAKGRIPWNKGVAQTEEVKQKLSVSAKERHAVKALTQGG